MTTVDQVAPIEPATSAPMPAASRLIGAIAVFVALLSATATFLVLAGLTPIVPVDSVVKELLLGNVITGLLLLAIIGREVWVVVQARRRPRRLTVARSDRRPVRRDRCGSGGPRLGRGKHDSRPRPRPIFLDAHARHDPAVADRGQRLCGRSRPDHPRRDSRDGL